MDDLNKQLRESLNAAPPASPPPGQWSRIRNGQLSTEVGRPFPRFGAGLLLGLLLSWLAWLFLLPQERVPVTAPADENKREIMAATPVVLPPDTVYLRDTIYLERRVAYPVYAAATERSFGMNPAEKQSLFLKQRNTFALMNNGQGKAVSSVSSKLLAAPSGPVAKLSVTPADTEVVALHPYDPLSQLRDSIILPSSEQLAALARQDRRASLPKGRWEFGIHVTPHIEGRVHIVNRFSAEPRDIRPVRTFAVDGEDRELYYQGTENIDGRDVLRPLLITHLEAARQFRNGWRVGLGFGVYNRPTSTPNDVDMLARLFEGEYYQYSKREDESLFLTFSAGYTFRKRKRLQYHLGLMAIGNLSTDASASEYLYSRDDRQSYFLGYQNNVRRNYFNSVRVLPQLDIQYQLSKRFSIGLEVMPGIGIGGRLKL